MKTCQMFFHLLKQETAPFEIFAGCLQTSRLISLYDRTGPPLKLWPTAASRLLVRFSLRTEATSAKAIMSRNIHKLPPLSICPSCCPAKSSSAELFPVHLVQGGRAPGDLDRGFSSNISKSLCSL